MNKKKRTTSSALEIMNARYGQEPGWHEGVQAERRKLAIGHLIREAREAAGLTQAELARRARTSQSAISRLEDASYEALKLETLRRIAAALDAPLTIGIGRRVVRLPVEKVRA
jgi:HTH-type transcriptional regulator/antitoxin HipB